MEERDLTEKQRRWLEASRKIGRGAMTKSERETLERLYADMLPLEQQELAAFIQENYAKKDDQASEDGSQEAHVSDQPDDPISKMEQKQFAPPSKAFMSAVGKSLTSKDKENK